MSLVPASAGFCVTSAVVLPCWCCLFVCLFLLFYTFSTSETAYDHAGPTEWLRAAHGSSSPHAPCCAMCLLSSACCTFVSRRLAVASPSLGDFKCIHPSLSRQERIRHLSLRSLRSLRSLSLSHTHAKHVATLHATASVSRTIASTSGLAGSALLRTSLSSARAPLSSAVAGAARGRPAAWCPGPSRGTRSGPWRR